MQVLILKYISRRHIQSKYESISSVIKQISSHTKIEIILFKLFKRVFKISDSAFVDFNNIRI